MASRVSCLPRYVVTSDSAPVEPVAWQTPFFKATVLTFSLIAIVVVTLYFVGIIDGSMAVETVVDDDFPIVELDAVTNTLCKSYSFSVVACIDVSIEEITENGCISYVESTGHICANDDNNKTLCVVNEDCPTVEFIPNSKPSDDLCKSFSIAINACSDVSIEAIADIGCRTYVDSTGGICVSSDESKTSCIVNDNCERVDLSGLISV